MLLQSVIISHLPQSVHQTHCYAVTYILLSVPGTLLAKAILPSTSIAIGALIWSIAATCQAAAFTPAALYVCRLFVGVGEALFGQAMALYFTYWYLPNELSKRIGLFISAGSLAGACVPFSYPCFCSTR